MKKIGTINFDVEAKAKEFVQTEHNRHADDPPLAPYESEKWKSKEDITCSPPKCWEHKFFHRLKNIKGEYTIAFWESHSGRRLWRFHENEEWESPHSAFAAGYRYVEVVNEWPGCYNGPRS